MKETVYYLKEAEAKAHGTVEARVEVLRVHKLTEQKLAQKLLAKLLGKDAEAELIVGEPTDEQVWTDSAEDRELAEDESLELEKVYYKVVLKR
jgi:Ser-tRNA(Ala) deacylase AlaX